MRLGTGEDCVIQCQITIVPTESLSTVNFSVYISKMIGKPGIQCLVWSPELDVSEVSENSDRLLQAMTTIRSRLLLTELHLDLMEPSL